MFVIIKTNTTTLKLIQELNWLLGKTGCFTHIVAITDARVPIIKCVHILTGFHCDLSISNGMDFDNSGLGVYNSLIVRDLIKFDDRIHPLTVILKYWMKTKGLLGSGQFTSYCLFLLIVYYLQVMPMPIIPALEIFQRNVPEYLIGTWNLAFNTGLQSETENTMSIAELLAGFFNFYEHFNFEMNIICPMNGRIITRNDFQNYILNECPAYQDYLRIGAGKPFYIKRALCVQDPYNLAYNVGSSASTNSFNLFCKEIKYASEMCLAHLDQLTGDGGDVDECKSSELLYKLFTKSAPASSQSKNRLDRKNINSKP